MLITGASSGIGAAMARMFASHGGRVGIHYGHSDEAAEAVLREIEATGGSATAFKADLLDAAARQGLIRRVLDAWGGVDVLVNNAGGLREYRHFTELDESAWDYVLDLQVKAPFCLSRDVFVPMRAQRWGRIISISSAALKYAGPNNLHYTSSKAALEMMMRGFAREGAAHNVLVNTIRSGLIDTPMRSRLPNYDEATFQKRVQMIPVGRAGVPTDIASMAVFLASSGGDFITGERFTVAGGD